jgi:hypothetical protein
MSAQTPVRGDPRAAVALPWLVLVTLVLVDAVLPADVVTTSSCAMAPLVAAALTSVRRTAEVAVGAVVAVAVSAAWNHDLGAVQWWLRVAITAC